MKNLTLIVCFAVGVALSGCRQQDITTVVISVPEMKNEACAQIVVQSISAVEKVPATDIVPDVANRTVTVTYDTMQRGLKNIEMAIAGAGFSANEVPADADAAKALPAACRQVEDGEPGGK